MSILRALPPVLLLVVSGCSASVPVRVLSSEPDVVALPEAEMAPPEQDVTPRAPARIGAPGGNGAGPRSVVPAQSGNDTVGGLPAGTGSGTGPRG
jgi:hypothetical protein